MTDLSLSRNDRVNLSREYSLLLILKETILIPRVSESLTPMFSLTTGMDKGAEAIKQVLGEQT